MIIHGQVLVLKMLRALAKNSSTLIERENTTDVIS
jgi:hypothetical protein